MASSLSIFLFINIIIVFSVFPALPHGVKLPFRPKDVLPLLPRHVSWPILNSLHSAVDLLPTFVGAASDFSSNQTLEWKGACFYNNTAWMEFHNKTGSEFGGGTLHIKQLGIRDAEDCKRCILTSGASFKQLERKTSPWIISASVVSVLLIDAVCARTVGRLQIVYYFTVLMRLIYGLWCSCLFGIQWIMPEKTMNAYWTRFWETSLC